jgi:hypothetical protein
MSSRVPVRLSEPWLIDGPIHWLIWCSRLPRVPPGVGRRTSGVQGPQFRWREGSLRVSTACLT